MKQNAKNGNAFELVKVNAGGFYGKYFVVERLGNGWSVVCKVGDDPENPEFTWSVPDNWIESVQ